MEIFSYYWSPLWLAAALVAYLIYLMSFSPKWQGDRWSAINSVSTMFTAAAAISIPLVIDQNAFEARTLDQLNTLNRKLSTLISQKRDKDFEYKINDEELYSYQYIKTRKDVEAIVFSILNEYESMCLGMNNGWFDDNVFKKLRWDALTKTYSDYGGYIKQHRESGGDYAREAWIQCGEWLENNQRSR